MSKTEIEGNGEVNSSDIPKGDHQAHEMRDPKTNDSLPSRSPSVQYQLKQVVGKGSYGVVYRAVNKKSKQTVAIKEINYDNDEELSEIMIEIDLLKNLNHINIVKYHGFIQKSSNLYIILEYASHGSLKSLFAKRPNKRLEENETTIYIKQTLHGLNYLHEQGVIHRDIKAANLLLDANNVVKLADFGVSTMVNNTAMTLAGSLNWMAPEIITNKGASTLSDIWSLGATVVELMTGNPPFHNLIDINIYYAIENDKYYPPDSLPDKCKHFLKQCFHKSMYRRPTAAQLLKHPWLRDIRNVGPKVSKERKLSKFQENDTDMDQDWDSDFTESTNTPKNSLTNFVAKRASNSDIYISRTSSPGRPGAIQLHRSPTRSPVKLGRYVSGDSDIFDELNKDINELEDELPASGYYYLEKIRSGGILAKEKLPLIFNDCKTSDIVECLFLLLRNECIIDEKTETMIRLFEYDIKSNESKVKNQFINYGGLIKAFDNEQLISKCFLMETSKSLSGYQFMFQCGIMNHIQNYNSNPCVYLELVYRYLDVTSIKFWYNWCVTNLDVALLVKELSGDKRAQSILIKLSSWDNRVNAEHSHWTLQTILPKIIDQYSRLDSLNLHCMYIVLKSMTLMLQTPYSDESVPDDTNTPYHSVDRTPSGNMIRSAQSNSNNGSPIKQTYLTTFQTHEYRNSSINDSISALALPVGTQKWLLGILGHENTLIKVSNIHVWKYFTKVCYNASHLDPGFLSLLYSSPLLFQLLDSLLDQYKSSHNQATRKSLVSILRQWLMLLVEISRKKTLPDKANHEALFFQIVASFMKLNKFSSLGIEIILNILQRNGSLLKGSTRKEMALLLKTSGILGRVFYEFDPEDIDFSAFVNRYTKLCSLQPYDTFCKDILCQGSFLKRIQVFFETYESSILIQLDLLKLLKVLFLHGDHSDSAVHDVLVPVVKFLNSNWKSQGTTAHQRQVGGDSVLLIQLCNDLRSLISSS
ncbi:similar to Saccharomyces cerevisiae YAR019C CDC15 Protein kinase of the Mitotic Exit Network that is localized to the spindle pole bodies at late anaphase [Maudiozyma barnettii]|uniref:non-specific serine/threonine protein kinase n=1 Tax=Maudiozyma barnettii TaxID=61262 RepID=A0A8H2VKT8_9SACH|nr:serine/threonine protein kinase CDC15 [Kazachstania barnettii]CAB4257188.1 similar to Saccharomyces cerevisiae YAR019C CDC15 Protein kinase of the Mitotic Exit Network that is localized to the spindle pole bodies at late anaphase [Kazachstania barnettii]CAD1779558.1 similar to Saccharomyces cerevisiae YAR019C CDC15 Protein kinase of the Mitotic Exit Network that is localized to the spindle pole bodies at late anaphase [Kazachstania barnettii]